MNDQNDDGRNFALMVLAGVVALVLGGVLALAASKGPGGSTAASRAATAAASLHAGGEPDGRVHFGPGSAALPAEASETLVRVADSARAQSGKIVLISSYHDADGDAASHAELAGRRAQAVRHALEANGVAADRLVLDKPMLTSGGADPSRARRVEIRLR